MSEKWSVNFQIFRYKEGEDAHFDSFTLEVDRMNMSSTL
jgi:hypothetical protein